MSASAARQVAYEVLGRVRQRDAFAGPVLDDVLTQAGLDTRDAALGTRLAYGSLQTMGTLDEALDRFLDKPSRVEPRVRDAMRVAAYELLFLRTPSRAAVHQAVEAVKAIRPQAAGLANAVLRRLAEAAPDFPWGDPSDPEVLARHTAHPGWLVRMWLDELGPDRTQGVLRADNEAAPLFLWHNPFAGTLEDAFRALVQDGARPLLCEIPSCIEALDPPLAVRGRAVASGLVLVTDAGAQIAPRCCDPRPGQTVLDVAAGRGTKTTELQALAAGRGGLADVYALDIHGFKTDILARRAARLRVPGITALTADATDLRSTPGIPDSVDVLLLDAPCSGLGALRRRPERRWKVDLETVERLSSLQSAMLEESSRLVRPGGAIVYSTCTIARRENEQVVEGFLGGDGGRHFRIEPLGGSLPEGWHRWLTTEGFFQSLPEPRGPDGHFVAVLRRV